MDEITLKQLKESNYHHPEITEVIHDNNIMITISIEAIQRCEIGINTVWDSQLCNWGSKYFGEALNLARQMWKEKGLKFRLITEIDEGNIEFLSTLDFEEIRHLDGLRGNFGIYDGRAYMAFILHKEGDEPLQTFFSNTKNLVKKQQELFEDLWKIARPFSIRKKELEYERELDTSRKITETEYIQREIESLALTCKKELTIISSNRILSSILNSYNFMNYFPLLIERNVTIKILTDNADEHLIKQIASLNALNLENSIQLGYMNKLGDLDEMVIVSDAKHLLNIQIDSDNKLIATFSNEPHSVLVQELMFEKHWNEVKSLTVFNNN